MPAEDQPVTVRRAHEKQHWQRQPRVVRDATNAWRASSGAAGGPPVKAPIIRLLLGQIMPRHLAA